jgi:hypothetical protein
MSSKKLVAYGATIGLLSLAVSAVAAPPAKPTATSKPTATPTSGGPTPTATTAPGTPIQLYGAWLCGNHYCDWSLVRNTAPGAEFDVANHWMIDRGDGSGKPSVNVVVLSFIEPLKLLNQTTDANFVNGLPRGMTPDVVSYFRNKGITVLLSAGGVTYTSSWDTALTTNPAQLATLAKNAVTSLGADGFEIDYENGTPTAAALSGLETFISTYGTSSGLLTIDLAAGDRYLQELSRRAAADWLPNNKIAYINAMVPGRGQPATTDWQEHIDGKANYAPPILPKAPAKVVGSIYLTDSGSAIPECNNFASSTQKADATYAQTVQPNGAGITPGLLGYMFWAAECPSTRNACTTPPNSCQGGVGVGASTFNIPIPIGSLRAN